jgi:hypothetical protein
MEMLDRYLKAVQSCLPETQREDIVNELGENLRAQFEDKEAELGRPLTEAEVEVILKQHGHPLVVAGRYRQDQRSVAFGRQWIGPVLFPFYIRVLKFNLGLTSLVLFVVFTALFLGGKSVTPGSIFPTFMWQFLIQFGVLTLIFSLADRHWKQHPDSWDPRNLKRPWHPAFAINTELKPRLKKDPTCISRFDSISQLVGLTIGLIWLRVAQQAPFLIFGPAAAFLEPAPIWHHFYAPVLVLWLGGMLQALINFIRPDWVRLPIIYRALGNAFWIVSFVFLIRAGQWVVLATPSGASAEGYVRTVAILNQITAYGLIALTALAGYELFRNLRRLLLPSPRGIPAA